MHVFLYILFESFIQPLFLLQGFTPEVRTWEVCFDKSGSFSKIKPAFQLSHAAGVYNFSFNADATRLVLYFKK
jgi:hypothetical protein